MASKANSWFLGLLVLLILVAGVGLVAQQAGLIGRAPAFPGLHDDREGIASVTLRRGVDVLQLVRGSDSGWRIASAANAPVHAGQVEAFLAALAAASVQRERQTDAEDVSEIGLMPPVVTEVILTSRGGEDVDALLVGASTRADQALRWAAPLDRSQLLQVADLPAFVLAADQWADVTVPQLNGDAVLSMRLISPDGSAAWLARPAAGGAFAVSGSAGLAPGRIEQLMSAYANLRSDAMKAADAVIWAGPHVLIAEHDTGLVVSIQYVKQPDGSAWARFNAHNGGGADAADSAGVSAEAERINMLRAFAFHLPAAVVAALDLQLDLQSGASQPQP